MPSKNYLKNLKDLCIDKEVLLIFDEVQTGFGRTGEMFASQTFGVTPDISTFAKAVAGGFPMGVVMASEDVSDTFIAGRSCCNLWW